MQKSYQRIVMIVFAVIFISACTAPQVKVTDNGTHPATVINLEKLNVGLQILRTITAQLEENRHAWIALHERSSWQKRGFITPAEHDDIEQLLFRFFTGHTVIWDLINSYGGPHVRFAEDEMGVKAQVLILYAEFLLAHYNTFLVAEFAEDPVAVAKLNEGFYRLEIPRGIYDKLRYHTTDEKKVQALEAGWILFLQLTADPESNISRLASVDSDYGPLIAQIPELYQGAKKNIADVLDASPHLFPATRHRLSSTEAAKLARRFFQEFDDSTYAARAVLFGRLADLKGPVAKAIVFTKTQKKEIYKHLQPGDIILTYTAGYMSNIFIPGVFKHAITFVGSLKQRRKAGLGIEYLPEGISAHMKKKMETDLSRAHMKNGEAADVIEAVSEGVIVNNFGMIMDTHINRMVILRPFITEDERWKFILKVFSFLGNEYDFYFDFADASKQVCTEVIYRALNGKSGIELPLVKRAGHLTMSADDLVYYYLGSDIQQFELVLIAEKDPDGRNDKARLLFGKKGEKRIDELMADM